MAGTRGRPARLAVISKAATVLAISAVALVLSAPVLADPGHSNVPSLAWRGETLRLVVCGLPEDAVSADWVVEEWSGDSFLPPVADTPSDLFEGTGEHTGEICMSDSYTSVKPGLAVIKFVVNDSSDNVIERQLLAGWMALSNPTLSADKLSFFTGDGPTSLRVGVTGTVPMNGNFAGLFPGDSVELPRDWPALAQAFAQTDDPFDPDPASSWDIHDDRATTEGHTNPDCDLPVPGAVDAVDNCAGGGELDSFSRAIGALSFATVGPFDPQRPGETFLPDGKLDADDAPMPAAEVSIRIGQSGSALPFGSLEELDKSVVYSRDGLGAAAAHNYFAPFYGAYLPATEAPVAEASGVDGPRHGANFLGFRDDGRFANGAYEFWRFADPAIDDTARLSGNRCRDELGAPRPAPSGFDDVTVYTDEHGETLVAFDPSGYFFVPDLNNRCEIGLADGVPSLIGQANLIAQARYPYRPIPGPIPASPPLLVSASELGGTSLSCVRKSPTAYVCIETMLDLGGSPIQGAAVRFMRDPSGPIAPFAGHIAGFNTTGQTTTSTGAGFVQIQTNALGQAGVEIPSTLPSTIDVLAESVGTRSGGPGIFRTAQADFGVQEYTSQSVGPGGTVSTGSTPSPSDPVETSVTSPNGGLVAITERTTTASAPAGYSFFGNQINITAPEATAANPLRLVFSVDGSALGGADSNSVQIFRNGAPIDACAGPAGTASPDPCIESRTALGSGAQITVLSSHASIWNLGLHAPYTFSGFFSPISNSGENDQKAGSNVPIKFALAGDQGINVLAAASPRSQQIPCGSTVSATGGLALPGSLSYDPAEQRYHFNWKTDKAWAGTCRQLVLQLTDGSYHRASFKFK